MRRQVIVMMSVLAATATAAAAPAKSEVKRVADAARVITELRSAPDSSIPQSIWDRAHCVLVMPDVKKAAFLVGGEFGEGVVSCRTANGWTAPVFMVLVKGSFGAQFGAESTDLVLLIMNKSGMERLLQDAVTLGADASVAAGPVGRSGTAATNAQLTAEMLSYSRSRGLFAGIDLSGGVLRLAQRSSRAFYGHEVAEREILLGSIQERLPAAASPLMTALRMK